MTLLLDGQVVQGTLNGHLTGGCDLYQSITADGRAVLDLFVSAGDEDGPFVTAVMGRKLKKKTPYIPEFTEEENLPF